MLQGPGYLCSNDQCFLRRDIITSQTSESLAYNKINQNAELTTLIARNEVRL